MNTSDLFPGFSTRRIRTADAERVASLLMKPMWPRGAGGGPNGHEPGTPRLLLGQVLSNQPRQRSSSK